MPPTEPPRVEIVLTEEPSRAFGLSAYQHAGDLSAEDVWALVQTYLDPLRVRRCMQKVCGECKGFLWRCTTCREGQGLSVGGNPCRLTPNCKGVVVRCDHCHGTGQEPCEVCGGSGESQLGDADTGNVDPCEACNATGHAGEWVEEKLRVVSESGMEVET